MKCFQAYLPILLFLLLTATPAAIANYAKPGCNDTCGNVTIPFPFGIGAECSVNQWYIIECTNSIPYLSALNRLEVLNVSLSYLTVTVGTPRITDCQNPVRNSSEIMGVDLDGTPFFFSKIKNKFVFKGCGIAAMHMDNGSVVAACSTACHGVTGSDSNNCFGIGCCQTTIPHYLKSYNINITGLEEEDGGCTGSAFLVDDTSYDEGRFSDSFIGRNNNSLVPISLLWTLADSDQFTCCDNRTRERNKVELSNGTLVETWRCYRLRSLEDSPYLIDGCPRIDPESTESKECRWCMETGGRCKYDYTYYLFGPLYNRTVTCDYSHLFEDRVAKERKTSLGVILGT
ncbi:putative wall-associated receptor kinase, galacturonan-binding domain-containing protein [Helianthus annuus]|nr:putative wall-associated receptor kinase, galacturonan-binding domain-containing protein [Helianthus annuus]KAJ0840104.1 putative wall-associated receptor kinase, galacturonan-binding domain-containing protein [Helianthus annuus]